MNYIEIKAPAKINIGLNILSKREDGFHNLSTLFYPINDLFDLLTFQVSENFKFICNAPDIPSSEVNLVVKAKILLEKYCGREINVQIRLKKNIPSQAGLGGGSSDAAATLISLNEMFHLELSYNKLIELALMLGSDVPFFVKAKPAIGASRGEILDHIDVEITEPILIVNPRINISTKEAFQKITPKKIELNFNQFIKGKKLDYELLKESLKNDFEQNVFEKYPEIKKIKTMMYECGALFSLMSGSGSSVYGMFSNLEDAEKTAASLPNNYFKFISKTDFD